MGGGVSLGTYSAGALTELYHALKEINRTGDTRVRVEVLVGASAGSMTAAIFAKALIADDPAVTALMYDSWVNQIDITRLAPADATEFDPLSLLQADAIDSIGARALEPPGPTAPWSNSTDPLHLAFTGTNLGGIPLAMPYGRRNGAMVFDDHADAFITRLNKTDPASLVTDKWHAIRRTAIASGAFPVAFPPREVPRDRNEPPISTFEFLDFPKDTENPLGMWYCDGGVFDNEPIGLARKLASLCTDYNDPHFEYRYIVIDHDLARNTWKPLEKPTSLTGALGVLVGAVLEQGTSKDYLRATKVNEHANSQRVAVTQQLRPMVDAIPAGAAFTALAQKIADGLSQSIALHFFDAEDQPTPEQIAAKVAAQRVRIAASQDYASALAGLAAERKALLIDAILLSEVTAGLLDKRVLDINIVAPDVPVGQQALAGAFLWNFGGFFDRSWRQHDFDCGRRDARRTLTNDMGFSYAPDDAANYTPADIPSGVAHISAQRKDEFLTYLTKRVEALIRPGLDSLSAGAPFGTGWMLRWVIPRIPRMLASAALGKIPEWNSDA